MAALTLKQYMRIRRISVPDMATELGRTRQNVDQWLAKDATVKVLDGERLEISTTNIVHQPQVKS